MIEEYRFGLIIIKGKTYNFDVEVRDDGEVLRWQRKESHIIDVEDVERALSWNPGIIVIGRGMSGVAQLKDEAEQEIKKRGIELFTDITEQAVKTFNMLLAKKEEGETNKKIVGLFHLTC